MSFLEEMSSENDKMSSKKDMMSSENGKISSAKDQRSSVKDKRLTKNKISSVKEDTSSGTESESVEMTKCSCKKHCMEQFTKSEIEDNILSMQDMGKHEKEILNQWNSQAIQSWDKDLNYIVQVFTIMNLFNPFMPSVLKKGHCKQRRPR
ncbi:hypothetical protein DPMN_085794 [Dreissena polymorpha]|uniref:Uncharacterized protein n=1 Tax=Dreissena polymorpha TaxID=45954 RepID=A0A9D4BJQ9_DREPO|nr:hypothetical protein DPMN_085794 [Dreissena polymorpha]